MEGRDVASGVLLRLHIGDGLVRQVECLDSDRPEDCWISPGWIDLQINGLAGVNFGDPELTVDGVRRVATKLWSTGTTHFLPTLITDSVDRMAAALGRLADAAAQADLAPAIPGIHLEGPFLSPEDGPRGAHPIEHCIPPSWDAWRRLQDAAGGRVVLVTLAPELPGALDLVERLTAQGVRVAIGHTAADRAAILGAIRAGATMATHLGNAAHDRIQRHHNYIFDQLGADELFASLIVDGHHLPPHLVRSFARAKGVSRTALVSDAVQYTHLPPGVHDGGYRKFEVRADGYIGVLGEPRMAGSGVILRQCIERAVRFGAMTLAEAVAASTAIPARILGIDSRLGRLHPGCEASFVRFRWDEGAGELLVEETILKGRTVFRR